MRFSAQAGLLAKAVLPVVQPTQANVGERDDKSYQLTLEVTGKRAVAWSNNGHIQVATTMDVGRTPTVDGGATITAVDLLRALKTFSQGDELELTLESDSEKRRELIIRSIRTGDSMLLPAFTTGHGSTRIRPRRGKRLVSLPRLDLIESLRVGKAAGTRRNTKWEIDKSVLRIRQNQWRAAAYNGKQLLVFEQQGVGLLNCPDPIDLYFNRKQSTSIMQILDACNADTVVLSLSDSISAVIQAASTEITVLAPLTSNSWPDEQQLLDRRGSVRCVVELAQLNQLVKAVLTLTNKKDKSDSEPTCVLLRFDPDRHDMFLEYEKRVRIKQRLPVVSMTVDPGVIIPKLVQCEIRHLRDLFRFSNSDDHLIQLEILPGDPVVLVGRYGAGEEVCDDLWERDLLARTRRQRSFFFRVNIPDDDRAQQRTVSPQC